ncbi:hypothetical protein [Thomasclavelia ramosa]|uniref:hypothetical protein n=1 Tax=Thomasclavelia ramosa TaxID=1547 RepID=UPI001F3A2ED8|nr:hypothetical protein [Thomasclavelia ramosa]MCB5617103.1 hypothetical protein [Thomasclavelia ramosa]
MSKVEIIERLNEIKRVVDSNSLEELIEAYPDVAKYVRFEVSVYAAVAAVSACLIDNLIKDIENGKVH